MSQDTGPLRELLAGGGFGEREWIEIAGASDDQTLLVTPIDVSRLEAEWTSARSSLEGSEWWPIAVGGWGERTPEWTVRRSHPRRPQRLPEEIISASLPLDPRAALSEIGRTYPYDDWLDYHLSCTRRWCGSAPAEEEVRAALDPSEDLEALERWLFEWEQKNCREAQIRNDHYPDWFEPIDATYLLFLPIEKSEHSLAYVPFYGEEAVVGATPERQIAVLRSWREDYGAELIANWGTMIQFVVERPPQSVEQSWGLAWAQDALAPYNFSGPAIPVREAARGLIGRGRWMLHERP
jgi:hypothetical protein